MTGREVTTLVEGELSAGRYETEWDGRDGQGRLLPSGLYLYRIEAGAYSETRQMMLLK